MKEARAFDEEKVQRLLAGSDAEADEAVALIHEHLRDLVGAWLHSHFPGAAPDDLANIWAQTLVSVLTAARLRRFQVGESLLPWLRAIAYRRAVDHIRRVTAWQKLLETLRHALREAQGGQLGRLSQAECQEVMRLIRQPIHTLSDKQLLVFRVWAEGYPETTDMKVLRQEVVRVTGKEQTLTSIKRSLQEARRKVRDFLRARGYDPWQGGEE
ncbi:MAG TPA: hypothetical protein VG013_07675 [Gemmataceae bacterium]|jgi:DNA-directed RNA polymerase specialized sigma24 family protein|nr:hypothetical protein [Gemmataceae bacterium]